MADRRLLKLGAEPAEAQRAYDYLDRWSRLLEALAEGKLSQVGWGHASPEVIFVLPAMPTGPERQLMYRMAESLHVPCYFTYAREELALELAILPANARTVAIGTEIPTLAEMVGEDASATQKKREAWLVLREKAKSQEVF